MFILYATLNEAEQKQMMGKLEEGTLISWHHLLQHKLHIENANSHWYHLAP
jgi:hypothetical protein